MLRTGLTVAAGMFAFTLLAGAPVAASGQATTAPAGVIVFDHCLIHGQGITGLCSILPSGKDARQLTDTDETNPSVSFNGKSIAFNCGMYSKFGAGICIKTGRHVSRLTRAGADPSWSPSGKEIVFDSCGSAGGICVIDLRTRKIQRLTSNHNDELPQWSPKGSQVLYVIAIPFDNSQGVYVTTVTHPHPRHIVQIVAFDASWSPNGLEIAYDHGDDGAWIMGANGTGNHQLVSSTNDFSHPSWSPSGRAIVGLLDGHLHVVSSAGGTPRQISGLSASNPDWGR